MHRREAATALTVGCPGDVADLYDRTVADVYSYLASRVGDRGVAEDLTQDVFEAGARRVFHGPQRVGALFWGRWRQRISVTFENPARCRDDD